MISTRFPRRLRMPSALLGVTLLSGAILASAAPAGAEVVEEYVVSGTVVTLDENGESVPAEGVFVDLYEAPYEDGDPTFDEGETWNDGTYLFEAIPNGDYEIDFYFPDDDSFELQTWEFTVDGADVQLEEIVLEREQEAPPLPELAEGEITVTGDPIVGEVLKITTTGWPDGVTLHYQWGFSTGQSGGPIEGATSPTLTVTKDQIGYMLSAFVTAEKAGFAPTTISLFSDEVVTAPKKPAAPAPVTDSGDLADFLAAKGSTPDRQESVGLPAGSLSPVKDYQAELVWQSPDSYVDVYLYSEPVFVGSFPVVGGVVQIELSADVLSALGGGGHTLVVLGQSSGAVSSVEISLAATLASTGADPVLPFAASGVFLVLGAVSLIAARRMRSKA